MRKKISTKVMVLGALMTALVILLQYLGSFIRFGPFSISLVLIPIVIGAITCGKEVGAWLGFVFGVVVLLSGDAAAFLAVNIPGTILVVILKGIACGYLSGLIYEVISNNNKSRNYFAAIIASVICPFVNTLVFLLGCFVFYMDTISGWAVQAGAGSNVAYYIIFILIGGNFLFELAFNIIFAPVIVHILKAVKYTD